MIDHNVKILAKLIFKANRSQVSDQCWAALARDDLAGFGAISVDPRCYDDAESYFRDIQCVSFLKKYDPGVPNEELEAKALNQFLEMERRCALTSLRMDDFLYGTAFWAGNTSWTWDFVSRVRKIIRDWLGSPPSQVLPRFGPGATFSDKGRLTTIMDKMSSRPTVTPNARMWLDLWTRTSWFRALALEYPHKSDPETVEGNRFTTVPKDSTKRRNIAVEPSINIFYQLAVGREIRDRLKRIGIDLNEGQSRHRALARKASVTGEYATLDLSNASDTISKSLVQVLLPPRWYEILESLRSPKTLVDGRWHVLEKFSSMGNGFTFELETLVFLALLKGLHDDLKPGENLFVYGDDIIVPTKYAKSAVKVLQWAGFTINEAKSFIDGPFRESCGGDFFRGQAVRPCFLKAPPAHPTDWIALANSLWRTAVERYWQGDFDYCESRLSKRSEVLDWLMPAWSFCISQLPNKFRAFRGPHQLGDILIHDIRDEWRYVWKRGIRYFPSLITTSRRRRLEKYPGSVALAALVYGVPSDGVAPRGALQTWRCKEVPFS